MPSLGSQRDVRIPSCRLRTCLDKRWQALSFQLLSRRLPRQLSGRLQSFSGAAEAAVRVAIPVIFASPISKDDAAVVEARRIFDLRSQSSIFTSSRSHQRQGAKEERLPEM